MIMGHKTSLKKTQSISLMIFGLLPQAVMWGINEKKTNAMSSFVWKFLKNALRTYASLF